MNAMTPRVVICVPTMQLVPIHLDLMNASALMDLLEMDLIALVSAVICESKNATRFMLKIFIK